MNYKLALSAAVLGKFGNIFFSNIWHSFEVSVFGSDDGGASYSSN
jgi:hypothetical protein